MRIRLFTLLTIVTLLAVCFAWYVDRKGYVQLSQDLEKRVSDIDSSLVKLGEVNKSLEIGLHLEKKSSEGFAEWKKTDDVFMLLQLFEVYDSDTTATYKESAIYLAGRILENYGCTNLDEFRKMAMNAYKMDPEDSVSDEDDLYFPLFADDKNNERYLNMSAFLNEAIKDIQAVRNSQKQ